MSVLDAHPTPKPGAHWPPGFKERADAQAAAIVERVNAPKIEDVIAKLREQLPSMLQHELFTGAMGLSFETALGVGMTLRDIVLEQFIQSLAATTEGQS